MLNWIQEWINEFLCIRHHPSSSRSWDKYGWAPVPNEFTIQHKYSKSPCYRRAYLHFLFDINLTGKGILFFIYSWSSIFFPDNHLFYWRTFCFFESLRSICINAWENKVYSIRSMAVDIEHYLLLNRSPDFDIYIELIRKAFCQNAKALRSKRSWHVTPNLEKGVIH